MKHRVQRFSLALVLCALAPGRTAQSLQLVRADGTSTTLAAAQIAALPQVTVNVRDHDKPASFEGAPLSAVLSLAGVQLGTRMRGPRLTEVLLVEATDGYKVVFAVAEVDPDFANREILLADKRDGKPLDALEGPFRIVAPGDQRPARWIRQVTSMQVVAVK